MAVFLLNVCKFNECGIQFPNLTDLIHHIEATHIGEQGSHLVHLGVPNDGALPEMHRPIAPCRCKRDSKSSFYN